ncbi:hypothetical protein SAMN00120144_4328 [Hymenobacter roseosalivarius DSM 11622]|uniref:Uncharacterized protein n=1 Tax=Hymenobacter roseosalivarius DSM 11622 TaxID=645990 RepID=A0A1W1UI18_9BACT|nr:hypothetical protein SAMN00120144_4328 [Hymenobacter roseosalivarius DSM 11622]
MIVRLLISSPINLWTKLLTKAYPGFRQVGEKSSSNFWLLVQHADAHPDFQRRALQLMLPELNDYGLTVHRFDGE